MSELHGKTDMLPGTVNTFWVQADEPGVFRGICAEHGGLEHARMPFLAVASERAEFDARLAARRRPGKEPAAGTAVAAGRGGLVEANCVACHTVCGTSPPTRAGPDLSDLATGARSPPGRDRTAAPSCASGSWIRQATKPGARMPATALPDDDLEALLDDPGSLAPDDEDG